MQQIFVLVSNNIDILWRKSARFLELVATVTPNRAPLRQFRGKTMRGDWNRRLLAVATTFVTLSAGWVSMPADAAAATGPLRIAVFGDSIIWGQGLPNDQKMWFLFAQDLQAVTGRPVEVSNYSHSGAPLSYLHAGTADVFPGNCADGNGAPGEVPDPTTAVIDCQIPQAAASGQRF